MRRKIVVVVLGTALVTGGAVAWAVGQRFPDVGVDNPRFHDIDQVAAAGWFVGRDNGSYSPASPITAEQIKKVLDRVYGRQLTRAEFASFLIGGYERVRDPQPDFLRIVGGSQDFPVPFADTVQIGDWQIRLDNVLPDAWKLVKAESQYNDPPDPGYQYVMVGVEATWLGTDVGRVGDLDYKAVGTQEAYSGGCSYLIPDRLSGEVASGGSVRGNVCWAVKHGEVDSLVLRVQQGWRGEVIWMSLK